MFFWGHGVGCLYKW